MLLSACETCEILVVSVNITSWILEMPTEGEEQGQLHYKVEGARHMQAKHVDKKDSSPHLATDPHCQFPH
jgi:hypothetical protein